MRFPLIFHVAGVVVAFIYTLYRLSFVLKTMMEDTSPYVLTREELALNGSELIPRIIHQVFLGIDGKPMPEHWKEPQRSCIDLHPDWEYMVSVSSIICSCWILKQGLLVLDQPVCPRAP